MKTYKIEEIEVETTTNNPGWYVPAGAANEVQNKAGEWFSPAGTVTRGTDGISVMLEHDTIMHVLGDQDLFNAACESVCRAACGIINLTQHDATQHQRDVGVIAPKNYNEHIKALLTFDTIPTVADINRRATKLAEYALESGCKRAMIGGAPYLMSALETALKAQGIAPVYAFSQRESVETVTADGIVTKTNMFKHIGFVEV